MSVFVLELCTGLCPGSEEIRDIMSFGREQVPLVNNQVSITSLTPIMSNISDLL